jgi:hypothetical protein
MNVRRNYDFYPFSREEAGTALVLFAILAAIVVFFCR